MTWRGVLAVVAGLLLIMPLALLWGILSAPGLQSTAASTGAVPVLSAEQRRRLTTYRHECETTADCESPLACLVDDRAARRHCIDSNCRTDVDCSEGFVCRSLSAESPDGKPHVRLCVAYGGQAEGQPCSKIPHSQRQACQPGLLCYGWCGRPCRLEEPASCPAGFACQEGINGPACLPDCESQPCPEGQQCVHMRQGVSVCAIVSGLDCTRTPCPEAHHCNINRSVRGTVTRVGMECVRDCGEGSPPCPEGEVCDSGGCYRVCHPSHAEVCGAGRKCGFYGDRWLCSPVY